MHSLSFLQQFIRRPRQTGALLSSGAELCQMMVREARLDSAKVVLEFGTGSGEVTERICRQKACDTILIGLEINKTFAEATIKRCPEVEIINGSATQAKSILHQRKLNYCDSIISSLPWAVFSEQEQDRILKVAVDILCPGGVFLTFFYLHSLPLLSSKRFNDKLRLTFQQVRRTRIIWANVPPAVVYVAIK